jgi:hypothetical protein
MRREGDAIGRGPQCDVLPPDMTLWTGEFHIGRRAIGLLVHPPLTHLCFPTVPTVNGRLLSHRSLRFAWKRLTFILFTPDDKSAIPLARCQSVWFVSIGNEPIKQPFAREWD